MKRSLKKYLCLVLAVVMVMGMSVTAFAQEPNKDTASSEAHRGVTIETTEEYRDQVFDETMAQIMSSLESQSVEKGPQYHYKTEYYSYQYKTVGGYAGNQAAGGYRFQTGGGFGYSESGGPSVSGSVSLSLPAPYNFVSFSVNLGNNSSSGKFVTVPNTTDYFKLYVSKVVEVRPYAVYRARSGTENWELDSVGGVPITYSVNAYAKKVS